MHAVMGTGHRNLINFIESYLQRFRCYVRCLLSMLDRAQNTAVHGCHSEIEHLDWEKTALMSPQSTYRKLAMIFSIYLTLTLLLFKAGQWSQSLGSNFINILSCFPLGANCLYGPLIAPKDLVGAKICCAACAL